MTLSLTGWEQHSDYLAESIAAVVICLPAEKDSTQLAIKACLSGLSLEFVIKGLLADCR